MAHEPNLRAATPEDIPALADACISAANFSIPGRKLGEELYDLHRDIASGEPGVSPPGKLRRQFQNQMDTQHLWLAEVGGKVVGSIAWYGPGWNEQLGYKPGEITSLFVHASFHDRGIGTMLLHHAKQQVAANFDNLGDKGGRVLMEVRCFEKSPRALKFYERGGFVRRVGADKWLEEVGESLALLIWIK
ncbi:acyl-CoA N-acyltransferase [Mycena galericulata]|nr:acyl-CoA N-acyltransferase [Mycena galericulata]